MCIYIFGIFNIYIRIYIYKYTKYEQCMICIFHIPVSPAARISLQPRDPARPPSSEVRQPPQAAESPPLLQIAAPGKAANATPPPPPRPPTISPKKIRTRIVSPAAVSAAAGLVSPTTGTLEGGSPAPPTTDDTSSRIGQCHHRSAWPSSSAGASRPRSTERHDSPRELVDGPLLMRRPSSSGTPNSRPGSSGSIAAGARAAAAGSVSLIETSQLLSPSRSKQVVVVASCKEHMELSYLPPNFFCFVILP